MIELNDQRFTCPVDVTLNFIGGKWKILILSYLHWNDKKGFGAIRDNLPGVSEKMLSQQLKELERDKLIGKSVISLKPYRVEYSLTPSGEALSPVFEYLSQWGIRYLKDRGIDYVQDQDLYKPRSESAIPVRVS